MLWADVLHYIMSAASTGVVTCTEGQKAVCPVGAFTAIGAAFATQGMWLQADVLYYLNHSAFGLWAPLLYMCAAAAGFISLAMGMPPKMYLWFFVGPGIYSWLIGTTEQMHGVAWRVAGIEQDQRQVWRLAEVGLRNLNITVRQEDLKPDRENPPSGKVKVANFFLNYDRILSSSIDWMIKWTGLYRQLKKDGKDSDSSGDSCDQRGEGGFDRWYLLSDLKWTMLENITGARLNSGELRDTFATFLSSECGDGLSRAIDKRAFIAAANARSGRLPCTVFMSSKGQSGGSDSTTTDCSKDETGSDYEEFFNSLATTTVPLPVSMRNLWRGGNPDLGAGSSQDQSPGSFPGFFDDQQATDDISWVVKKEDNTNCAALLYYIIQGFRWEAGHIYYQLVSTAPEGMAPPDIVFSLFYGWDLRDPQSGEEFSKEQKANYLKDLILIHLFRNEIALNKKMVDKRFSSNTEEIQGNADTYLRNVGSKSKYAEVYSWALMVPYVQGILLYLFAMGYPFACVLMVVPGWHKSLFTWMSFWAWLRLWDLGFAIVKVIERSVWSILGNTSMAYRVNSMVLPMQHWGTIDVKCANGDVCDTTCPIPEVTDAGAGKEGFVSLLKVFDRALVLGANMDLDLSNAYYIYIMSALYFAVPAVTGQLVLGAKAGATGMLNGIMGGIGGEAARGATSGFTSSLSKAAAANAATTSQEAYAKEMRNGGLAASAISASNSGAEMQLAGSRWDTASRGLGMKGQNLSQANAVNNNRNGLAGAYANLGAQLASQPASEFFAKIARGGLANLYNDPRNLNAMAGKMIGGGNAPSEAAPPDASGAAHDGGAAGAAPTGAETGAATGGQPTGGVLANGQSAMMAANSGLGLLHQAAGMAYGPISPYVNVGQQVGAERIQKGYSDESAKLNARQAQYGLASFNASSGAQLAGLQERRGGAAAQYNAEMAAWATRRTMGNQLAGSLGAMGADTSYLSPGNKPTEMWGMAMSGMLGADNQANASGFAFGSGPGSYAGQQSAAYGQLEQEVGPGQVWGAYKQNVSSTTAIANQNEQDTKRALPSYYAGRKTGQATKGMLDNDTLHPKK